MCDRGVVIGRTHTRRLVGIFCVLCCLDLSDDRVEQQQCAHPYLFTYGVVCLLGTFGSGMSIVCLNRRCMGTSVCGWCLADDFPNISRWHIGGKFLLCLSVYRTCQFVICPDSMFDTITVVDAWCCASLFVVAYIFCRLLWLAHSLLVLDMLVGVSTEYRPDN